MVDRFSPGFRQLLDPSLLEDVESHAGAAYGLWPDFRLAYFNPACVRFARENGGDSAISSGEYLGTSVIEITPEVMRPFYRLMFLSCLHQTRRKPIQHRYDCPSPQLARDFVMTLYRLGDAQGLLVVNSLVVEGPHDATEKPPMPPDRRSYLDPEGFVHECAHCRRVQHLKEPNRWDWVPAWVERHSPEIRHVLCSLCHDIYEVKPAGTERRPGTEQ